MTKIDKVPLADLKFTPMQARLLNVLKDGRYHNRKDLLLVVDPGGYCDERTLSAHLLAIKNELRKSGHDVIRIIPINGITLYQFVLCGDWPELFELVENFDDHQ